MLNYTTSFAINFFKTRDTLCNCRRLMFAVAFMLNSAVLDPVFCHIVVYTTGIVFIAEYTLILEFTLLIRKIYDTAFAFDVWSPQHCTKRG
jgi:hypothetical protein